jgi:dihydroflavonol-4-reductase
VGGNLVRLLLSRGRDVRAFVRDDARAVEGLDVEKVRADVLDPPSLEKAFRGVHVVYHLAAGISVWGDDGGMMKAVNVEGASNVAEACLRSGVKRLIHFSSIHAMDQVPGAETLDETRACVGEGALTYDRSKALGEAAVLEACKKGLEVVVISPTGIIGPFDFKPSPMGEILLSLIDRKLPALVDGGFDWVDVRDVCKTAVAAEDGGVPGAKYILSGTFMKLGEIAQVIEKTTGARAPRFVSPMWLAKIGAPFSTMYAKMAGTRPLYTLESLKIMETCNRRINSDRARRELGFSPRPLEETIADTCRWFLDHRSAPVAEMAWQS